MANKNFLPKKVNKKEEYLGILWAVLLFVGVALVIYFNNHKSAKKIKENHVYTIGTVRDYSPSRTGKMLNYTFSYKGKAYTGGYTFYNNNGKFAIGKKFLVILYSDNPDIKFFIPFSIPNGTYAPPEGWKEPPFGITEKDVMRYLDEKY